jgi:hypothetical protein
LVVFHAEIQHYGIVKHIIKEYKSTEPLDKKSSHTEKVVLEENVELEFDEGGK